MHVGECVDPQEGAEERAGCEHTALSPSLPEPDSSKPSNPVPAPKPSTKVTGRHDHTHFYVFCYMYDLFCKSNLVVSMCVGKCLSMVSDNL